jgi:Fis family transcriptional regulator
MSNPQPALRDYVAKAVRRYLLDLGSCDSHELYDIVLREIEMPMLAEVMRHCEGNQSRAAATLGLNRATLRKKLKAYGLT